MPGENASARAPAPSEPEWLALVRTQVQDLRYGVIQLVVHDGRVTQIERTEKVRLGSERPVRSVHPG
jgi:hypothetical protein